MLSESVTTNNHNPTTAASKSDHSSFDLYHFSNCDEEFLTPKNVTEITLRQSNHVAHILTTTRLYFHPSHQSPNNLEQIDPYLND